MAWNQGNNGAGCEVQGARKIAQGTKHKAQGTILKGLIAGAVVVLGAVGAFVYLTSGGEQPAPSSAKATEGKKIAEGKVVEQHLEVPETPKKPEKPKEEEYIEVDGKKIKLAADPKTGKPKYDKDVRIIPMRKSDIKPRRFEYDAEEDIAAMLEIEPGTLMYGELPYGKRFNEDLKKAIMKPVEIKPTDDEYTVALKKQVQEVKDQFKETLLNGGDPAAEMKAAREELIRLGQYRNTLVQQLNELRKSGEYTSQDIKDYLTAANKMMEENGLKPITMPAVLLRNMELKERRNQQ